MDTIVGMFHSFAWKFGRVQSFDNQFFPSRQPNKRALFPETCNCYGQDQSLRDRDPSLCPKRGSLEYQRAG